MRYVAGGRTRRAFRAVSTCVVLTVLVAVAMGVPVDGSVPSARAAFQPFAPGSPFRTPIPDGAAVDPNSAAMIASATRTGGVVANLVMFGIPIYFADASTPRHSVECTITSWGPCPFAGRQVPIPDGARPHRGSDGAMVVVDNSTGEIFEFWQARHDEGRWTTSFGAVNSIDGTGWGGNSTATGASRLAGVIQIAEIAEGVIPHALALQTDNACAGTFRYPAVKTDGHSSRSDCIPEGARIRLDPAVDLSSLPLPPAVRTVARAMQVYGAYVVDSGGAPLSVSFELDPAASNGSVGPVYQEAGLRWDYDDMPGVPWHRLQVLS